MLPGQILSCQFASIKDGPRRLPLGLGLGVDFTFANNNNNNNKNKNNKNPHLIFNRREGTRGLKFGTQT